MDFKENKNDKTPRTDAAASINSFPWLQFESEKLERELNTATVNEAIAENKVHILEKELKQAQDRIKRLEVAGEWAAYARNEDDHHAAIKAWEKAKEAKP
jgi:hypothetical protein